MKLFSFDRLLTVLALGLLIYVIWQKTTLKPNLINGTKAPEFTATLAAGEPFSLSQFQGKYVLLDFWASWCAPCRRESDDLVALYQQYHLTSFKDASGFEIVSVSLDTKSAAWLEAIQADGLSWTYHTSELKGFEASIAKLYDVRAIPTKFLINPAGIIIGVNQSVDGVNRILKKRIVEAKE